MLNIALDKQTNECVEIKELEYDGLYQPLLLN